MGDLMGGQQLRVGIAASAGGHLIQLLKISESWKNLEPFCITTSEVVRDKLKQYANRIYVVGECNREHPVLTAKVLYRCMKIVIRERPDVIISTGAAAGCITCILGKLLGAKIVWVDSITNVDRISLSGRMVRYIADLFLVQWPELAEKHRNVEYVGSVI
jgi:UDP-N-acetylglucosamine:LPS N-acetylglucosamine transferase